MDLGALISVIVLILFFSSIFVLAISYEIWKVKKSSSNKKKLLNKKNKQVNTDSINKKKKRQK